MALIPIVRMARSRLRKARVSKWHRTPYLNINAHTLFVTGLPQKSVTQRPVLCLNALHCFVL